MISRYTKEVVLCYDSDGAGQKATAAAIELLKAAGVKTKVLSLSGAKDPDEYIKKMGASAFESLIFSSENATLYKISKLKQQYNIDNIEEKIELTNKMAEIFATIENTIEREFLMKEVSVQLGISFESIDAQVKLIMKNNASKQAEKEFHDQSKKDKQRFTSENTEFMSECKLISLMFAHPAVYNDLKDKISDDFFKVKGCSELLKQLRSAKQKGVNIDIATAISSVSPEYSDTDPQTFVARADLLYRSDVAVEDPASHATVRAFPLQFIIVAHLHHAVSLAEAKIPKAMLLFVGSGRIECLLQHQIQMLRPRLSLA